MSVVAWFVAFIAGLVIGAVLMRDRRPRRFRNQFGVETYHLSGAFYPTITFWRRRGDLYIHLHKAPQEGEVLHVED